MKNFYERLEDSDLIYKTSLNVFDFQRDFLRVIFYQGMILNRFGFDDKNFVKECFLPGRAELLAKHFFVFNQKGTPSFQAENAIFFNWNNIKEHFPFETDRDAFAFLRDKLLEGLPVLPLQSTLGVDGEVVDFVREEAKGYETRLRALQNKKGIPEKNRTNSLDEIVNLVSSEGQEEWHAWARQEAWNNEDTLKMERINERLKNIERAIGSAAISLCGGRENGNIAIKNILDPDFGIQHALTQNEKAKFCRFVAESCRHISVIEMTVDGLSNPQYFAREFRDEAYWAGLQNLCAESERPCQIIQGLLGRGDSRGPSIEKQNNKLKRFYENELTPEDLVTGHDLFLLWFAWPDVALQKFHANIVDIKTGLDLILHQETNDADVDNWSTLFTLFQAVEKNYGQDVVFDAALVKAKKMNFSFKGKDKEKFFKTTLFENATTDDWRFLILGGMAKSAAKISEGAEFFKLSLPADLCMRPEWNDIMVLGQANQSKDVREWFFEARAFVEKTICKTLLSMNNMP